jgi:type III secretion protein T
MFETVSEETLYGGAVVLGGTRALGILVMFPIFTLFNISGILRYSLAVGLSAPSVVAAFAALSGGSVTYLDLGLLSLKEFGFGALLGIGFGAPFWAAQAAGDMTDIYRGANAPNIFDPVNALETSPLGSLLMSVALMLYVAAGGILDLVSIFYRSFDFWPVMSSLPEFHPEPLPAIIDILAGIFKAGAILASPFLIVMVALELPLTYTARTARQLQLDNVLPVVKNLAVAAVLMFYVVFAGDYLHPHWIDGFSRLRVTLMEHANGR